MDSGGADLRQPKVFPAKGGDCVEEPLGVGEIGLHLGCGKRLWPGWLNVDLEQGDYLCDIRILTLPDSYAERAAAIHVFEHLWPWDVPPALAEWKRVLRPGGKLVLELPNLQRILSHIFIRMNKGEQPSRSFSWLPMWGDPAFKDPAMMHKWGYFPIDVENLLKDAGFVDITHEEARYHFPIRDMRVTARKPKEAS